MDLITHENVSRNGGVQQTRHFAGETAVLLIDFENFYISREKQLKRKNPNAQYNASQDLKLLSTCVPKLCRGRRLIVQRAYADFDSLPPAIGPLMRNGIEPVQVFRFGGRGSKNAADMRMAMDAGGLTLQGSPRQYVLVSGDADFIPVCLELRRRGAVVSVIGVRGRTARMVRPYCDHFIFFQDLIAGAAVQTAHRSAQAAKQSPRCEVTPDHSVETYRTLLNSRSPRIRLRPRQDWENITAKVISIMMSDEMLTPKSLQQQCLDEEMSCSVEAVKGVLFQLKRARCFVPLRDDGGDGEVPTPKFEEPIALAPDIKDVNALRQKTQRFIVNLLRHRLASRGIDGDLDKASLAKLLFEDDPSSADKVDALV